MRMQVGRHGLSGLKALRLRPLPLDPDAFLPPSVLFAGCNLNTIKGIYNQDTPLSIDQKKNPLPRYIASNVDDFHSLSFPGRTNITKGGCPFEKS